MENWGNEPIAIEWTWPILCLMEKEMWNIKWELQEDRARQGFVDDVFAQNLEVGILCSCPHRAWLSGLSCIPGEQTVTECLWRGKLRCSDGREPGMHRESQQWRAVCALEQAQRSWRLIFATLDWQVSTRTVFPVGICLFHLSREPENVFSSNARTKRVPYLRLCWKDFQSLMCACWYYRALNRWKSFPPFVSIESTSHHPLKPSQIGCCVHAEGGRNEHFVRWFAVCSPVFPMQFQGHT